MNAPATGTSLLILSASAGAGHVRAAEALVETAARAIPSVQVRHQDILEFTFPLFKKFYSRVQFAITDFSPELWGYFFRKTEFPGFPRPKSEISRLFNHFNYKAYLSFLDGVRPDILICTHFLPYIVLAQEKARRGKIPVFAVTTDYDLHSLWVENSVNRYYVACEQAAWTLRSHGVPGDRIHVSGIPVLPDFTSPGDQRAARQELSLEAESFTILVLSGGYGVGTVDELVAALGKFLGTIAGKQFQLLVSAARNEALYRKLQAIPMPPNVASRAIGLVHNVDKLMDAADILITKAGGLTLTEALTKHLPMILYDPTPGQENRNALYLMEEGAAWSATSPANLNYHLNRLIADAGKLREMKENARRIARPEAAEVILRDVLRQIEG